MKNCQHKQTFSFFSSFQPHVCFVFLSLTDSPSTPIRAHAICMPLEFSLAENVLVTHSVYIIQSSRSTPPPPNPILGGFFFPPHSCPRCSLKPLTSTLQSWSKVVLRSLTITIFPNTRVQWKVGTWNFKYWREWWREGLSSGSLWHSEEEEELSAHLDAHFGRISAGRLLWSLSFPSVCCLSRHVLLAGRQWLVNVWIYTNVLLSPEF